MSLVRKLLGSLLGKPHHSADQNRQRCRDKMVRETEQFLDSRLTPSPRYSANSAQVAERRRKAGW